TVMLPVPVTIVRLLLLPAAIVSPFTLNCRLLAVMPGTLIVIVLAAVPPNTASLPLTQVEPAPVQLAVVVSQFPEPVFQVYVTAWEAAPHRIARQKKAVRSELANGMIALRSGWPPQLILRRNG